MTETNPQSASPQSPSDIPPELDIDQAFQRLLQIIQTQGKIERWHQTLKNRILLENYYFPSELEAEIGNFVDYYNLCRYHESLNNLTPADVYFGCGPKILQKRERIKHLTLQNRRLQHQLNAA